MDKSKLYKVVLVFNLRAGMADEELQRSNEENSFPNLLAKQPGFAELEPVKINNEKTMPYRPGKQKRIGGQRWKLSRK